MKLHRPLRDVNFTGFKHIQIMPKWGFIISRVVCTARLISLRDRSVFMKFNQFSENTISILTDYGNCCTFNVYFFRFFFLAFYVYLLKCFIVTLFYILIRLFQWYWSHIFTSFLTTPMVLGIGILSAYIIGVLSAIMFTQLFQHLLYAKKPKE